MSTPNNYREDPDHIRLHGYFWPRKNLRGEIWEKGNIAKKAAQAKSYKGLHPLPQMTDKEKQVWKLQTEVFKSQNGAVPDRWPMFFLPLPANRLPANQYIGILGKYLLTDNRTVFVACGDVDLDHKNPAFEGNIGILVDLVRRLWPALHLELSGGNGLHFYFACEECIENVSDKDTTCNFKPEFVQAGTKTFEMRCEGEIIFTEGSQFEQHTHPYQPLDANTIPIVSLEFYKTFMAQLGDIEAFEDKPASPSSSKPQIKTTGENIWDLIKERVKIPDLANFDSDNRGECRHGNSQSPSVDYNPDKEVFYCHKCRVGGDVIAFYEYLHGCDRRTAITELATKYHLFTGGKTE